MKKSKYEKIVSNIVLNDFIRYYIKDNHSFCETLDQFNFESEWFLLKYLRENNISKKSRQIMNLNKNVSKEEIIYYYIEQNHSIQECANHFNCSYYTFKHLLKNFNIIKPQKDVLKIAKTTKLKKYGDENYNNVSKGIKTKISKYGSTSYNNREKATQTLITKYGSIKDAYKSIQEKIKVTNNNRYGVDCVFKSPAIQSTIHTYMQTHYGTPYYVQSEEFKEKSRATCLKKYGVEFSSQSEKMKIKSNQTYHKKLAMGISHYNKSTHSRKYTYNNIYFDSSWELALYIYLSDNNVKFEYQPDIKLEYTFNGLVHWYFPDFKINNELFEIKSDYLYKVMTDKQFKDYSEKENAKFNIMKSNNIKILLYKDIKPFVEYVNNNYGSDYLQTFRNIGEN